MPRVDAHGHLWDPIRGDYGWLTREMTPLYRRFGHTDVKPLLDAANIEGAVLIQAAATSAETDYLLAIAESLPWVLGVVGGWISTGKVSSIRSRPAPRIRNWSASGRCSRTLPTRSGN